MKQLRFDEVAPERDERGRFLAGPQPQGPPPASAEVATIEKGDFLSPLTLYEYPNASAIIRQRSEGQGIRFYDTMLGSDSDLEGFFRDLLDDVLHYPYAIKAASEDPAHKEHARFANFAWQEIPHRQNFVRHLLEAYARGFSVTEKMYRVVERGEWKGAVVYDALLDKPQRWFSFDMDRRLRFRTRLNFFPGELVDQGKFVVVTFGSNDTPWGFAVLDYCYWPWTLKHHALKNQAVFMEKWASPTAIAEYEYSLNEKLNEQNRDKSLRVLMSIQNDQSLAVPKGMLVRLLESLRNGTVSFESYIGQLTEMESRLVTGQLLTSMGAEGGSHALGKVHEKRAANKVEMLADFASTQITRHLVRELIDRNYGPQDAYPTFKILAKSPTSRQADAELEKVLLANGHKISRAAADEQFMIVSPDGPDDELMFPVGVTPSQDLPVNPQLAAPVVFAAPPGHAGLHAAAKAEGTAHQKRLDAIGSAAAKAARPAIKRVVKSIGNGLRKKKKASSIKKADVYRSMNGTDVHSLGMTYQAMFSPAPLGGALAAGDASTPPAISTDAKLALALQMVAIAERIASAADDAPASMDGEGFADSLTDPAGLAVDGAFANLFEGTHSTNIATLATAQLRAKLADPKFRAAFPYVMIVATNPNARVSHSMLDGFVLTAEEARYSPLLPPFDFGCDCRAVPISSAQARTMGLTGGSPVGGLDPFLRAKGATQIRSGWVGPNGQSFLPGSAPGFQPPFAGTDFYVQLAALRAKAEELRAEDPEAWAALSIWLLWLFGLDVLRNDPPQPQEETNPVP
jgi:phage gp29-like protein